MQIFIILICDFYGCCRLTQITISSSVVSIGNNAFEGCLSLAQITIHSSVALIEKESFKHCLPNCHL